MQAKALLAIGLVINFNVHASDLSSSKNMSISFHSGKATHNSQTDHFLSSQNSSQSSGIEFNYNLTNYFSLGVGYIDFGQATGEDFFEERFFIYDTYSGLTSNRSKGYGFTVSAQVKSNNIFDNTQALFEIGLLDWKLKQSFQGEYISFEGNRIYASGSSNDSGISPFYGYGLNYQINDQFSVSLLRQRFKMRLDSEQWWYSEGTTASGPARTRQEVNINTVKLDYHF